MIIKNLKRGAIISEDVILCKGISRYTGLMFSFKKRTLIFEFKKERIIPVHMFFVFFPIDLIYLDKNKKVVEIKRNLKPFSFYRPKNKAKYLIEAPVKAIGETRAEVGDILDFKNKKKVF